MADFIVKAAWADGSGRVTLPDDVDQSNILNVFYHPVTNALGVAVLIPVPEKEPEPSTDEGNDEEKPKDEKD